MKIRFIKSLLLCRCSLNDVLQTSCEGYCPCKFTLILIEVDQKNKQVAATTPN